MMSIATRATDRRLARHSSNGRLTRRVALATALSVGALALGSPARIAQEKQESVDLLIIGGGIAGLSAALEAGHGGASVLVVDMSTVGGGHAIMSNGAISIIGTPLQEQRKIADSPTLAEKDFLARGEDNDPRWVAAYVRDSREWLYDWLTDLGVSFENLARPAGNSVPRLHLTRGKGLGLVEPIYRASLRHPNIRFRWATMADELIIRNGRVTGVRVRDLRRRTRHELRARNVIVATGGFQSNLKTVLANWPSELPKPSRLLVGAAHTATGSGHDLVRRANGSVSRLDHQWNYVLGLPDSRDSSRTRGLAAFNFNAIWVNAEGKRFTQEFGDEKLGLRALLNQPRSTYWNVFDEKGKDGFSITLAGYENLNEVRQLVYETPGVVLTADSLEQLAATMGVPAENLRATVARYNELTVQGIMRTSRRLARRPFPNRSQSTRLPSMRPNSFLSRARAWAESRWTSTAACWISQAASFRASSPSERSPASMESTGRQRSKVHSSAQVSTWGALLVGRSLRSSVAPRVLMARRPRRPSLLRPPSATQIV